MTTGAERYAETMVVTDFDETLFRAEGKAGYFAAWVTELATRFFAALRTANIDGANGLLREWYSYKRSLQAKYEHALDYNALNDIWQSDARNIRESDFDPVSFFCGVLHIEPAVFDQWLAGLEDRRFARDYLFEDAQTFWSELEAAPNTAEILLTQGGRAYQRHKVVASLGRTTLDRLHIISAGLKGRMIADAFDAEHLQYRWSLPHGPAIMAERVALIEDALRHLLPLPKREDALGVYLDRSGERTQPAGLIVVQSLGEAAIVLRRQRYM